MKTISERLAQQYPDSSANESAEVVPLLEQIVGGARPALLDAARGGRRRRADCVRERREPAAGARVGARKGDRDPDGARRRATRGWCMQMLAESLVLAVAGGALGVLLAYLALGADPDARAPAASRACRTSRSTARVLLVRRRHVASRPASSSAWRRRGTARGRGSRDVLKEGGRSSATGGGRWVRNALLVVEVALSIVLLVGATLLLRSFAKLTSVDPGLPRR